MAEDEAPFIGVKPWVDLIICYVTTSMGAVQTGPESEGGAHVPDAGETPLHALVALLRNSQLPPTSTNDNSPRGQSFCAGVYPEGGLDPKELDNCSCKSSWKHLKGRSARLQLRLDVAVLIMRTVSYSGTGLTGLKPFAVWIVSVCQSTQDMASFPFITARECEVLGDQTQNGGLDYVLILFSHSLYAFFLTHYTPGRHSKESENRGGQVLL